VSYAPKEWGRSGRVIKNESVTKGESWAGSISRIFDQGETSLNLGSMD